VNGAFSLRAPQLADDLFALTRSLPLVCPHGHVPVELLADSRDGVEWTDPAALFVTGDHYVLRMLYSLGVSPEALGMVGGDGGPVGPLAAPREVWRTFCTYRDAFAGTPTGYWVRRTLQSVFGLAGWPTPDRADETFDLLDERLRATSPLQLLREQRVQVIATTDEAAADLGPHRSLGSAGRAPIVLPTFRPDAVSDLSSPTWVQAVRELGAVCDRDITDLDGLLDALWERRTAFRRAGATASDHGMSVPATGRLTPHQARTLVERRLRGHVDVADAVRFSGHMLMEMAAMAAADGLVMQLHAGVHRDHHHRFVRRYGPATGSDIPVAVDFTSGLAPLLDEFGAKPSFRLVLFTLDESTYSRELAPLAGHYPAVRLGPPWWFLDSARAIRRYLDAVVETAGVANLAGFNDDTRNVATVAARHELWRSSVAAWTADAVADGLVEVGQAERLVTALAYGLAVDTYRLQEQVDGTAHTHKDDDGR